MNQFTFSTVGHIVFGEGVVARIGEIAAAKLGKRVVFVTDSGLITAGVLAPALRALADAGVETEVFSDVVAGPPESVVAAAVSVAQNSGAEGVIGLGGGSSMDVAKLVALLAGGHDKLVDVYGIGKAKGPRLPLLLAPTTAGTGSEVTPTAIVTTGASEKKGVVTPVILPDIALLDPELTIGHPPSVTAATGIDAMMHAIEAHASASLSNNPVSRGLARDALRLMGAALERAVHNGEDRAARADMLLGALLAGQTFANSPVAAVHALAHPIGGHFHVPHGLSNALMLPYVLHSNAETASGAYAEVAPRAFPELEEIGTQARAAAFTEKLAKLSAPVWAGPAAARCRHSARRSGDARVRRDEASAAAGEQSARGHRTGRACNVSTGVARRAMAFTIPWNRIDRRARMIGARIGVRRETDTWNQRKIGEERDAGLLAREYAGATTDHHIDENLI